MAAKRFRPPKTVRPPEKPSASWVPPILRRSRKGACNLSRTRQRMNATADRVDIEGDGRALGKRERRARRMVAHGAKPKRRMVGAAAEKKSFFRVLLDRARVGRA